MPDDVKEVINPEFALDENGDLVINDSNETETETETEEKQDQTQEQSVETQENNKEPESKEEQKEVKSTDKDQPQETEQKPEYVEPADKKYYTKEEIEQLGIDKLDPNKIPEELVPFYKSMQADYTRKTQQLAEERKRLEQLKQQVILQSQLAELHAQTNIPTTQLAQLLQEAKLETQKELGDKFDEFDPNTQALINAKLVEKTNEIRQQRIAEQKIQQAEQYLQQNDPYFSYIEPVFTQIVNNELTYQQVEALKAAYRNGDPAPFLEIYGIARERVLQYLQQQQEQQQTQSPQQNIPTTEASPKSVRQGKEPPSVENVGGENPDAMPKVKPSDLAGATLDEQAQMLIKMGIV